MVILRPPFSTKASIKDAVGLGHGNRLHSRRFHFLMYDLRRLCRFIHVPRRWSATSTCNAVCLNRTREVSTIEQIKLNRPRQLDITSWMEMIGRSNQRKGQDKSMEEHRCRIAASVVEDFRCKSLLDSPQIVTQDPRYRCLYRRVGVEVEDSRCNSVAAETEDPRCRGLSLKW
jgi:hypothetical protein